MKDDWQINNTVRIVFNRNWVTSEKLIINTTRGTVFVKGELVFTGALRGEDDIFIISKKLKKIEQEVLNLKEVKSLKWELIGYRRLGYKGNWERTAGIRRKIISLR